MSANGLSARPRLQIALDVMSVETAQNILTPEVIQEIDIVEAGTLLLASEGCRAVAALRSHIGDEKQLVADFKIADGAAVLAGMFLDAGADLTTVIAAANAVSMEKAANEAGKRKKDIQIELYGSWSWEQAQKWYDLGIHHIIFHHARDGAHCWNEKDVDLVYRLSKIGFQVGVTGGLKEDDIRLFKGVPVYAFIVGRTLYESPDIVRKIRAFQKEIDNVFCPAGQAE